MMRPEWTANGKALMCGGDRSEVDPCAVIKSNPLWFTGRSDPLCAVTSAVTFHVKFLKKKLRVFSKMCNFRTLVTETTSDETYSDNLFGWILLS